MGVSRQPQLAREVCFLEDTEIPLGDCAQGQFSSEDGEVPCGVTFSPLLSYHYLYNT